MKVHQERIRAVVQCAVNHLSNIHTQAVSQTALGIETALGIDGLSPRMTPIGRLAVPPEYLRRIAKEAEKQGLVFWQTGPRGFLFTRKGEKISIPRYFPSKIHWTANQTIGLER